MGALAPFYLAGLAALGLPLIFHLVRRTPRGRQEFSSLMFLAPSPPRLTRRSRLDQILLLLLRLTALSLLVFAFARPFLRETALLSLADLPQRNVAILLDTSASMRRGDLWNQAIRTVEDTLRDLGPRDRIALYTFAAQLQRVVGLEGEDPAADRAARTQRVREALRAIQPGWLATDLGGALTTLAAELEADSDRRQTVDALQIQVISDFQQGARLEAIQAFEWPQRIELVARLLHPKTTTNATLQLLESEEETSPESFRVRVANAADSAADQFYLRWAHGDAASDRSAEAAVHVPAGQSRVVRLPRAQGDLVSDRVTLRGDEHDFDNQFFVVPPERQHVRIGYLGQDALDDPQGLPYYLNLACAGDPARTIALEPLQLDSPMPLSEALRSFPLWIIESPLTEALVGPIREFVAKGGVALCVPKGRPAAESIPLLLDDVRVFSGNSEGVVEAARTDAYQLIGEIDFRHPLFVGFAQPRYSDFTKIHFWNHQRFQVNTNGTAGTRVVVRLDNGDPLLIERPIERGRVWVLASRWTPADSQFALSSKFVPFVHALLDEVTGVAASMAGVRVGEPVTLPLDSPNGAARTIEVRKPDGQVVKLAAGETQFTQTDLPGIYTAVVADRELRFAANLPVAESNTTPLDMEQFQQFGLTFGAGQSRTEELRAMRQQRDVELESRQKLWRWLIVAALVFLIGESWLAGRQSQRVLNPSGVGT